MSGLTAYTPMPGATDRTPTSVYDQSTLDKLKQDAKNVDKTSATDTSINGGMAIARQFEALFIQMTLKQARQSIPDGLFSSEQGKMLQSMQDEQMALNMASGRGIGLAPALAALMKANGPSLEIGDASKVSPHDFDGMNTPSAYTPKSTVSPAMQFNERLVKGLEKARANVQSAAVSAAGGISDKIIAFVERMREAAVKAADATGIHPELILSQAALETGWGQREITTTNGKSSYNLFGIKATSDWKGKIANVVTTEYIDGEAKKLVQPFKIYNSYEESFADYAQLLSRNPRYEAVLSAKTPKDAALAVQKAGYATDPQYAKKLINIMDNIQATAAS